ncbi:MAG: Hpt domain-containing protein [Burkholderiales bacterium]|nr:Hpt domain-containing protein [Ferrovum sp.]
MSLGNEPLIDRHVHSYLSDLLGPSDYRDLLRHAVVQLSETAACLCNPLGEAELGTLAHRIKGSLGSLGLVRLTLVAAQIEDRCRHRVLDAQDGLLFHGIVADSRVALENLLKPLPPLPA